MIWLYVAIGGAVGSVARYGVGVLCSKLWETSFPYHTLFVNIFGSFLMGVIIGLGAYFLDLSQELRGFLMIGILGGFTTFSSFSMDALLLFEKGDISGLVIYILSSVLLSLFAIWIGLQSVRVFVA